MLIWIITILGFISTRHVISLLMLSCFSFILFFFYLCEYQELIFLPILWLIILPRNRIYLVFIFKIVTLIMIDNYLFTEQVNRRKKNIKDSLTTDGKKYYYLCPNLSSQYISIYWTCLYTLKSTLFWNIDIALAFRSTLIY